MVFLGDITKGVSKVVTRDNTLYFVILESHLQNTSSIAKSFSDKFVSQRELLCEAALRHDILKTNTLNFFALIDKGSLFPRHAQIPDYLIEHNFNEFELDPEIRSKNWKNYYILNLIRSHHSGFNYDVLFDRGEFLLERENPRDAFQSFIRDWYALLMADWLDSKIVELVFHAREIPSLIDLSVRAEIDLQVLDRKRFRVAQEGILTSKVKLSYIHVKAFKEEILKTIRKGGRREKIAALMSYLGNLESDLTEVELIGS